MKSNPANAFDSAFVVASFPTQGPGYDPSQWPMTHSLWPCCPHHFSHWFTTRIFWKRDLAKRNDDRHHTHHMQLKGCGYECEATNVSYQSFWNTYLGCCTTAMHSLSQNHLYSEQLKLPSTIALGMRKTPSCHSAMAALPLCLACTSLKRKWNVMLTQQLCRSAKARRMDKPYMVCITRH